LTTHLFNQIKGGIGYGAKNQEECYDNRASKGRQYSPEGRSSAGKLNEENERWIQRRCPRGHGRREWRWPFGRLDVWPWNIEA